MSLWHAILLGLIEGVTEFLPISSTAHLAVTEKLLGYSLDDPGMVAFTVIIQIGAVAATILYLRHDIFRVAVAWVRGLFEAEARGADYRFGWAVILGSLPIGIVGWFFKDEVETMLRSLWWVAIALIAWSGVMWLADRTASQRRHEKAVNWRDTLIIGLVQCLALIPGVSRSGATMSAGLLRGLDRVAVTKLSFFLAIPALTAAGALQAATEYTHISTSVGWGPTLVATAVSFVVAYGAVAWLLQFVAKHTYAVFIAYRVVLGVVLLVLLGTNTLPSV